ncbi:MAG: ABC transporter permease [Phycisphaerales bacterium]|nr:ABC transporter permease [Planctomycetota bacterium]MCH8508702.1 ABC transporter permease [Phycisphaerales bacterium]
MTETTANSRPERRWLGGLFGHQESGLVIVILLMGLGLTIYGALNPIQRNIPVVLAPDAAIALVDAEGATHEPGTLSRTQIAGFRVTGPDGAVTTYDAADGWRYESARRTLFGQRKTNAFLNRENLVLVAKDASFFAIMAVGMTAVIILAGIDLSVGSIYGLSAIVGAMAMSALPSDASWIVSVPVGVVVCVSVGALCGLANGSMTVGLRVHPFVITLGMMAALRGLTIVLPNTFFNTQSIGGFPASFTSGFFKAEIFGVQPVPVLVMLIVAVSGWFVLSRTVFGRRVFAIGGNETAARYAGIPVGKVKIIVYTAMGALAGLSACVYLGYLGAAETNAGQAYELQVIAATVIGGASLMGGRGTALGAVLGAIVIQLISNAMIILNVDPNYNQIVMGAAIIIAVVIDQTKQRLSARKG